MLVTRIPQVIFPIFSTLLGTDNLDEIGYEARVETLQRSHACREFLLHLEHKK